MSKWLSRLATLLAEENAGTPTPRNCQNRQKGLVAVLAVGREGGAEKFSPANEASVATAATPLAAPPPHRLSKAEADEAHAQAWSDGECARYTGRAMQLMRRGLAVGDANDLAEALHLRDVRGDERRMCLECNHLQGRRAKWRCGNHARAGLGGNPGLADVWATRLQRCPGFMER